MMLFQSIIQHKSRGEITYVDTFVTEIFNYYTPGGIRSAKVKDTMNKMKEK